MLQLVRNGPRYDRLRVAAAHIEAAIAHINNEAQTRVPSAADGDVGDVTGLRLLVVALSDIRTALKGERPALDSAVMMSEPEAAAN